MKQILLAIAFLCMSMCSYAQTETFTIEKISEEVFKRIEGKSYKKDCKMSLDDLRYLSVLHYNFNGEVKKGEIICNVLISEALIDIFKELYEAKYPIEKIRLIDEYDALDGPSMRDNNSSAFNYRFIAGTEKLSNHSWGLAIDINPLYNPYVKVKSDGSFYVEPVEGADYVDRDGECPYMIKADDLCCRLFKKYGFEWGGDWTTCKDYQHFEYILKK